MDLKGHESSSLTSGMRRSQSVQDGHRRKNAVWGRTTAPSHTGGANASWESSSNINGADRQNSSSKKGLPGVPEAVHCASIDMKMRKSFSDVSKVEQQVGVKKKKKKVRTSKIYDDPSTVVGYASVPLLDVDRLPRGGISIETKAVGRIQFGIPPETIKDSMLLGLGIPSVYIVPVERFCREIGPALGINLAEFEFPAYFNYFVRQKSCTLVVDSYDAEQNIRAVFGETLLGPAQFRNHDSPTPNDDEDFDPSFPKEARPNFFKEFYHFRTSEESSNFEELTIDMLLDFCHFEESGQSADTVGSQRRLGVPPVPEGFDSEEDEREDVEQRSGSRIPESSALNRHGNGVNVHFQIDREATERRGDANDETPKPIQRSLSDPDLRKVALCETGGRPPSPRQGADKRSPGTGDSPGRRMLRRGSMESTGSFISGGTRSRDGVSWSTGASFMLSDDDEDDSTKKPWIYSQAKWLGEVATVYPPSSSDEHESNPCTARVEIFKMTGGTEYIVHDIDMNNVIVGKARFSGTVRVPDEMAVEGFLGTDTTGEPDEEGVLFLPGDEASEDEDASHAVDSLSCATSHDIEVGVPTRPVIPPTFHPPSFGVTVLGNSHGFDKNGSTSGYVLWINGRGVMIDPPPYSSATLEREGIRPTMIVAIIITHIHADHDAGTFQKVMTGSRVAIITTPTIYKSFIRKYAALSGLSPTLLRHSHRHRPAIVGQALKFQGATFHFTYTLHTIPCIAFKVEWRGRSMVFTGDHLNSPPVIDSLEQSNVLTRERADDLRRLPLQDCDALLHEAGAPPIHTPLKVLNELPQKVKDRLYVVHTSALPPESDLRVARTGTAGTIRLDEFAEKFSQSSGKCQMGKVCAFAQNVNDMKSTDAYEIKAKSMFGLNAASLDDGGCPNLCVQGNYLVPDRDIVSRETEIAKIPPLVLLRPACVSDAWFILNLLSNVPFLSSLSYSSTMEVLEIAQVEMYCANEVVVPAHRRTDVLCVVWEGTCVEREPNVRAGLPSLEDCLGESNAAMETREMGSEFDLNNFVYFESGNGLLQQFNPTVWHAGDWTGPVALQPDTERSAETSNGQPPNDIIALSTEGVKVIMLNMVDLYKILKKGSKLFRKYIVLKEKQAAEEAIVKAEMLRSEMNGVGSNVRSDSISGSGGEDWSAYDSVLEVLKCNSALARLTAHQKRHLESLAEGPRIFDQGETLWHVGQPVDYAFLIVAGTAVFGSRSDTDRTQGSHRSSSIGSLSVKSNGSNVEEDKQLFNVRPDSEYARLEIGLQLRVEEIEMDIYEQHEVIEPTETRQRSARDRFANKVLARLYSRGAYTPGLVFSRGHLLSDTSRMVSGNLSHIQAGRRGTKKSIGYSLPGDRHFHSSNMVAGPDGCRVMIFPRQSLVQFLDGNPGVLLSLLGTQIVV